LSNQPRSIPMYLLAMIYLSVAYLKAALAEFIANTAAAMIVMKSAI